MNPTPRSDGEERCTCDPESHFADVDCPLHDPPVTPPHQEQRCPTCGSDAPRVFRAGVPTDDGFVYTVHGSGEQCPDPFHSNPPPSDPHDRDPLVRQAQAHGDYWLAAGIESLTAERDEAIKRLAELEARKT